VLRTRQSAFVTEQSERELKKRESQVSIPASTSYRVSAQAKHGLLLAPVHHGRLSNSAAKRKAAVPLSNYFAGSLVGRNTVIADVAA
jgi:hypothetical protein